MPTGKDLLGDLKSVLEKSSTLGNTEYSKNARTIDAHLHIRLNMPVYPNSICDLPFVPGSPMQTDEVDKVLARLQCSHGLAMFLTWKGVMRNCGIRRVVRILLRRGIFLAEGDITGKMPKIAGKFVIPVHVFFAIFPP